MSAREIVMMEDEIERLEGVENKLRGEITRLKKSLHRNFHDELDTLDASVFSGDVLVTKDNRDLLKRHCESWLRQIKEMEDTFKESECPYCLDHALSGFYDQTCLGCIERMGK